MARGRHANRLSTSESTFDPTIHNTPDLPAIDWSVIGQQAPVLLDTPDDDLPEADVVLLCWAESEWAATEHVFCSSGSSMPYSARSTGTWSGWQKYSKDLPAGAPSDWTYWGYSRLIRIGSQTVLLFKSNTHLDWPGQSYLEDLIERFVEYVKPSLILSTGTAGGARTHDHVGTVNTVNAGTLYSESVPPSQWPTYRNSWAAPWSIIDLHDFAQLLFPVPTVKSDLESLCAQFNHYYKTHYTLGQLDAGGLDMGNASPRLNDMTGEGTPLLTTPTFVVATTAGNYADYACIEMDDAVIGDVCQGAGIAFGFVRNISDPVQNAALPSEVQGNWGSTIYDAYGIYTSFNGALAAWAMLAAR